MGAGGAMKYRHLGRKSSHRQALLRNLVTSLFEHESITTTWPKAKEAQRLAEKMITLGKRNTEAARRSAMSVFYTNPSDLLTKVFGDLRRRYATRPGGYTRVLRIEPLKTDQAPSAILELVDGPKDIRFAMTAATLARERETDTGMREITSMNIKKVTQFRPGGEKALETMVRRISKERGVPLPPHPRRETRKEKDEEAGAIEEGEVVGKVETKGKYQGTYGRHVGNRRLPRRMEERSERVLDVTDEDTTKEDSRNYSPPTKLSR